MINSSNGSRSGDHGVGSGAQELLRTDTETQEHALEGSHDVDVYGNPDDLRTDEQLYGPAVDDELEPNDGEYPGLGHL